MVKAHSERRLGLFAFSALGLAAHCQKCPYQQGKIWQSESKALRATSLPKSGFSLVFLLILAITQIFPHVIAAPGDLDRSFFAGIPSATEFTRRAYCVLPDGSLIVNSIRIKANGMRDLDFVLSPFARDAALYRSLPDGRFLAAGPHLAVLKKPDSLIPDFSLYPTKDGISKVAISRNGNIVVVGSLGQIGGFSRPSLAVVDLTGRVLPGFESTGLSGEIYAIAVAHDERVLIGGEFTVNGQSRNLARINLDGSLDLSLNLDLIRNRCCSPEGIAGLAVQDDGKILISGDFTQINGLESQGIARLNPDGSVDNSFKLQGTPIGHLYIHQIQIEPSGKILVGGYFNGRLLPSGGMDQTFPSGLGPGFPFLGSDGKYYVSLRFGSETYRGVAPPLGLGRLLPNGDVDPDFNWPGPKGEVSEIEILPDGRILIAGGFSILSNPPRSGLARLMPDGRPDHSLKQAYKSGGVQAMARTEKGLLVVGGMSMLNGDEFQMLRLKDDGSIDLSFDPIPYVRSISRTLTSVAEAPDGRIYVGGRFTTINGQSYTNLVRLFSDGQIDPSFQAFNLQYQVEKILPDSDGKVLVADYGTVKRLLPDGSPDSTFHQNTSTMYSPTAGGDVFYNAVPIASLLKTGGGYFLGSYGDSFNEGRTGGAVKIDSTGVVIRNFSLINGPQAITEQPDGKIIFGGDGVVRCFSDGTRDPSFSIPTEDPDPSNYRSRRIAVCRVDPHGDVILGGSYKFGGETFSVARFHGDRPFVPTTIQIASPQGGPLAFQVFGPPEFKVSLERSGNLKDWSPIKTNILIEGSTTFSYFPSSQQQFYRAQVQR